jgi:DNA repair photolyase
MAQLSFLQTESTTLSNTTAATLSIKNLKPSLPDPDLLDGLSEEEADQWASYLYAKPKPGTRRLSSRNHVISLYDPFAARKDFPAGRRWCVNVYTGCAFSCKYCYIVSYVRAPFRPRVKETFERSLMKDLEELQRRALHPAPIHISNSTDPLQPLEKVHRHTLFLLQKLLQNRDRFTTITILTKNPEMLCSPEYLEIVQTLTDFQVEVTCPFYRDEPRRFLEPGAPKIESRLEGIRKLREKGVTVSLRIDPIFPRDPLPTEVFSKPSLKDYGILQSQTEGDIEQLIEFASAVGCKRIIVSPLKLVADHFGKSELPQPYLELYRDANGGKPIKKGASHRLPWDLYHHWIRKPTELADSLGIELVYCKKNLITTV